MNCHICGEEIASQAEFCLRCGTKTQPRCSACQYPYDPGNRFCGNCGQELAGVTTPASPLETPAHDQTPAAPGVQPSPVEYPETPAAPPPSDIICPHCRRANDVDSAFCYACGLPLVVERQGLGGGGRVAAFEMGEPSGFWFRAAAYIIDSLVIVLPLVMLWVILGQPLPESFDQIVDPPEGYDRLQILVLFLTMAYDTVLITYFATTVGKRALGLYVVRTDGSRVSFARALARHFVTALSANLTLGLIFLFVLFREDRRGVHDLICDTVVIRRYRQRSPSNPGGGQ